MALTNPQAAELKQPAEPKAVVAGPSASPLVTATDPRPEPAMLPSTELLAAPTNSSVVAGAPAVGGIAGCCLLGPIFGIVGAVGATYVVSNDAGIAGEAARTLGVSAVKAAEGTKQLDRKHHLFARATDSVRASAVKAQELGEKWKVMENAEATARRVQEFEREHQLASRAASDISLGLRAATRAFRKLPNGWTSVIDQNHGQEYYVNNYTGESQWEFPTSPARPRPSAPRPPPPMPRSTMPKVLEVN